MSRPSLATPCPAPYFISDARRLSTTSTQDDTADLEYTRAIMQEFKAAKPRRRSTFQRRERKDAPITIFEDVVEDQELVVAEPRREIGGSTLLGRAARKMPRSSMTRPQETIAEDVPAQEESRSKHRVSSLADSIPGLRFKMSEPAKEALPEANTHGALKKDPRRRTIFVPSEDTTMMTIHPGANTTDRLNDTFQLPDLSQNHKATSPKPQAEQRPTPPKPTSRRPRMSLAVAPKRLPLQSMAAEKDNVPAVDVPGQNGGKENLPPGVPVSAGEKKPVSRLHAPTAASQARGSVQARKPAPLKTGSDLQRRKAATSAASSASSTVKTSESKNSRPTQLLQRPQAQRSMLSTSGPRQPSASVGTSAAQRQSYIKPSSLSQRKVEPTPSATLKRKSPSHRPKSMDLKANKLQHYPVLSGDLARPDLYEDDWLRHQEVALTEVINQLLDGANERKDEWHDYEMTLRDRFVEIYHQPQVSLLHQRLQASLLYGALCCPKDAPLLPSQDIGLRKRFFGLWLDSYREDVLRDAVEVVIGRQMPRNSMSSGGGQLQSTLDSHHGRRNLIGFLETFFIELQDLPAELDGIGRWRKIVSRSLMLIWLLDRAQTSHAITGCLFVPSSPRKSSVAMLQGLTTLLIPSVGDIVRTTRHLDYEVSYHQDPLDEVAYQIENLATDMRNGVILTRLVELLLFSDRNLRIKNIEGAHSTVTITTKDLEMLQSGLYSADGERQSRILSQHLNMPCLGRAQKVYNVELALSALASYGRLGDAVTRTTAEDIVNGHREKTLSLLWSLVSTYGLDTLVDFRELRDEIRRFDDLVDLPENVEYLSQHQQESLLQGWGTAICDATNLTISNLTTSFADGRAYAAIVEAYAPFCNTPDQRAQDDSHTSIPIHKSLTTLLSALGCSTAFTQSLASTTPTISSRQTTLSNLAFLASRLLPLKRRHNAAMRIQRAFRRKLARTMMSRRLKSMRVAHACAKVVQTRERLVGAAIVLQRAWRVVLGARIERLEGSVRGFQGLARGWLGRRKAVGRGGVVIRRMAGW